MYRVKVTQKIENRSYGDSIEATFNDLSAAFSYIQATLKHCKRTTVSIEQNIENDDD